MKTKLVLVFLFGIIMSVKSQGLDHFNAFRNVNGESYFRISYDNDLFTATDHNYTQGFSLEISDPSLRFNPINYLFVKPKTAVLRYGLVLEHNSFTPYDYELPQIQLNDRPFAASFQLQSFLIGTDSLRTLRMISSLTIGMIGPAALGREIQTGIHQITGDLIPQGWHHQIRNDFILNYHLGIEKRLFSYRNLLSFQVQAELNAGSCQNNLAVGCNTAFGLINAPFSAGERERFQLYLFAEPLINIVGYNATLQGGLFNRNNPHTIAFNKMEHLTGQFNFGLVLQLKKFYFEYSMSLLSKEYQSGSISKWGGFKLGFPF